MNTTLSSSSAASNVYKRQIVDSMTSLTIYITKNSQHAPSTESGVKNVALRCVNISVSGARPFRCEANVGPEVHNIRNSTGTQHAHTFHTLFTRFFECVSQHLSHTVSAHHLMHPRFASMPCLHASVPFYPSSYKESVLGVMLPLFQAWPYDTSSLNECVFVSSIAAAHM